MSIDDLRPGVHSFNFRSHNEAGMWGAISRNIFYLHASDQRSDEGAKIIGYRYSFNGKDTYVAVEPCDEYELNNKVIVMPKYEEFASLEDGCKFEFTPSNIRLMRENTSVFSLQFENANHKWSNPAALELCIADTLDRRVTELPVQSAVTLNKVPSGDFNALRIDIAETNNYYFKATQPCRVALYAVDGRLYQTLKSEDIVKLSEAGLIEGTYYGVVRDHKTDSVYSDSSVTIRLLLTEGLTPDPVITFADSLLTITAMDGAKVYYTLDGTTPTTNSDVYTKPIKLVRNHTVKAIAKHPDLSISDVTTYRVDFYKVALPEVLFANRKLYMTCPTPEAKLYYTIDGSDPDVNGTLYTEPVSLSHNCTVKVVGKREGYNNSDVLNYVLDVDNARCTVPVFTCEGNVLTLTGLTEGATYYFTLDGNDPTSTYEKYTAPIILSHNGLVKAYATKEGLLNSETVSFVVDWFQAETPTFDIVDNQIVIICQTERAEIHYTTDGTDPDASSKKYEAPIALTEGMVIKAIAYADHFKESAVAVYVPEEFATANVEFKYDGRYLTLETATQGATIYYTTDNAKPTITSNVYTGPFDIKGPATVKAIAVKADCKDSEVTTFVANVYFDGETMLTSKYGVVTDAFGWCDPEKVTSLKVVGSLNGEDLSTLSKLPALALLDIEETEIDGDLLPSNVFAGSKLTYVSLPKSVENIGSGLFAVCGNLAAIKWNSTRALPSTAMSGFSNPNLLLYVKINSLAPSNVKNVISSGHAESITLVDGEGNSNFYCPQEFTAKHIEYRHNYTQETVKNACAGWETLSLPFDVQSVTHATKGVLAPFAANDPEARPFWLCTLGSNGFVDAAGIVANTPYIIGMPNNMEYADDYILGGDVTFSAENVTVPVTTVNTAIRGEFIFTPTTVNVAKDRNVYALNVGEQYEGFLPGATFVGDLRDVRPFEAYLTTEIKSAPRMMSVARLGFEDESSLDGLEATRRVFDVRGEYGRIIVTTDSPTHIDVYSSLGVLLRSENLPAGESYIDNLAAGIYLVNGQKVVVR